MTDAAARIAKHAVEVGVEDIGIIVQRYVDPTSIGHLSNERRVSRSERTWLLEEHWPIPTSQEIKAGATRPDPSEPLVRTTLDATHGSLFASVAAVFVGPKQRWHMEWVADHDATWIVQADYEPEIVGIGPCSAWAASSSGVALSPHSEYEVMARAADLDLTKWTKARDVALFKELGLPHGDVLVIRGAELLSALANGEPVLDLTRDLQRLATCPVVVRTDVAVLGAGEMLSKHSPAIADVDEIKAFMRRQIQTLKGRANVQDIAFLAHRFIAARVGAFAYSRPDVSRVRIDATWGVPDSLLFHSHDTYQVDLNDPDRIDKDVRCKSCFVDVDSAGTWVDCDAGWNWDWKQALTEDEVVTIAQTTKSIANALGKQVQVMYFVGVHESTGHPGVLPWYIQAEDPNQEIASQGARESRRLERTIRSSADLRVLERDLTSLTVSEADVAVVLRPTASLLRDPDFLDEVGSVAKRRDLPVTLDGSILSHAFYVLRRRGVRVFERRRSDHSAHNPLPLNKLVRDLIPDQVLSRSEDVQVVRVDGEDHLRLLTIKALEESAELVYSVDDESMKDELADLFEVVRTVGTMLGLGVDQLADRADAKRAARGGFDAGIVLVSTRARLLGDRALLEDSMQMSAPGRLRPRVLTDKDGAQVIDAPLRGAGLDPVVLRAALRSGATLDLEVRHTVDGVRVTIRERPTTEIPNQLAFDF